MVVMSERALDRNRVRVNVDVNLNASLPREVARTRVAGGHKRKMEANSITITALEAECERRSSSRRSSAGTGHQQVMSNDQNACSAHRFCSSTTVVFGQSSVVSSLMNQA